MQTKQKYNLKGFTVRDEEKERKGKEKTHRAKLLLKMTKWNKLNSGRNETERRSGPAQDKAVSKDEQNKTKQNVALASIK